MSMAVEADIHDQDKLDLLKEQIEEKRKMDMKR
jgi:hypothetical protein